MLSIILNGSQVTQFRLSLSSWRKVISTAYVATSATGYFLEVRRWRK